jgi:recombination protein RecR
MDYPTSLNNLIECYKKLPGIGSKTAERLALSTLEIDDETIDLFSKSLKNVKTKIKRCSICNNLTEDLECHICVDKTRNKKVICVVDDVKNVIIFEKVGSYNGQYHVLDGLISPVDSINPEDINLKTLEKRITDSKVNEIIIALKPTIEGEITSLYIKKMLEGLKVKITRIAQGIPMGVEMEYMDALTLEKALEDRREI